MGKKKSAKKNKKSYLEKSKINLSGTIAGKQQQKQPE